MSSQPAPVTAATVPFVQTTTPAMERANRLMALRAHPGFNDLIRISQEIIRTADDQCANYPGWDPLQITVLKVRMQCAREHHEMLLAKISEAIQDGQTEARALVASLPVKTAQEAMDQGDYVRQSVLQVFAEQDNRAAGSY